MIAGPLRYVTLVADIAPLLRELKKDAGPHGVFVQRLEFAIRYAEFHQHNNQADMENAVSALMSIFEENLSPQQFKEGIPSGRTILQITSKFVDI